MSLIIRNYNSTANCDCHCKFYKALKMYGTIDKIVQSKESKLVKTNQMVDCTGRPLSGLKNVWGRTKNSHVPNEHPWPLFANFGGKKHVPASKRHLQNESAVFILR